MNQIRKRLTYANVMSSLAVFLVLGGAAFAAAKLPKNSVGTKQLKNNAVTSAKIKKNAVTAAKIKSGAVSSAKLAAGSVGGPQLADGAVSGGKLADGAVSGGKLADGAVTGSKLATGAVGTAQLGANSVGNDQTQQVKVFSAGAVPAVGEEEATSPKIQLGSVGPFNFYGKCFHRGSEVVAVEYIELTSGTAVQGGEDAENFTENSDGYLTPASLEEDRILKEVDTSGDEFNADTSDEEFQAAASDGTEITGEAAGVAAKSGNPSSGNGPFLAGDSCIIGSIAVFGS